MSTVVSDWTQPQDVTRIEMVFGVGIDRLMPPMSDIPDVFTYRNNPYVRTTSTWFFKGLDSDALQAKPGIDRNRALAHLQTILGSFEPQHQHKTAAVAYLMSLWFDLGEQES
jgi:hypothetical protein